MMALMRIGLFSQWYTYQISGIKHNTCKNFVSHSSKTYKPCTSFRNAEVKLFLSKFLARSFEIFVAKYLDKMTIFDYKITRFEDTGWRGINSARHRDRAIIEMTLWRETETKGKEGLREGVECGVGWEKEQRAALAALHRSIRLYPGAPSVAGYRFPVFSPSRKRSRVEINLPPIRFPS